MIRRYFRDWQARLSLLVVGAVLMLLSVVGILRYINVIMVNGFTNIDTLIFGLLAAIGLLGLGCLVGSLILQGEDSEEMIDDK